MALLAYCCWPRSQSTMFSPLLTRAWFAVDSEVHCAKAVHLLLNQACSATLMVLNLKSFRPGGLVDVSIILMLRVSPAGATMSASFCVLVQIGVGMTVPSSGLIFCSDNCPYHATVVKVSEKISLSCSEMFGVEVAA